MPLKRPTPDGGSTPPAKRACSDHEIASDGENEVVEFVNSRGEKFTVTLSPTLQEEGLRGCCPICTEKKLAMYATCNISERHTVCGDCILKFMKYTKAELCPSCNTKTEMSKHITPSRIKGYRQKLEMASFVCAACADGFSFSKIEKHDHQRHCNTPSENPFSYDPGVPSTAKKPQIMSNENLDKIIESTVSQMQDSPTYAIFDLPHNFITVLNLKIHKLMWITDSVDLPIHQRCTPATINLFKNLFKISFRYRECSQNPLTLQDLQSACRKLAYFGLAESLTWPDLDEDSTPPVQKTCSGNKADPGSENETVTFINNMGEKFEITLSPMHKTGGHCTVCRENKLAVYPTCTITDRHIACGTCISKLLTQTETAHCPSCNTDNDLPSKIDINAQMENCKQELEHTDFICAQCSDGFRFSEMKKHSHGNTPSEDPLCYDPDCESRQISDKTLETIIESTVSQIERGSGPGLPGSPNNFLDALNAKFPELSWITKELDFSFVSGKYPFYTRAVWLQCLLETSFRCREFSQDPLTLQELQESSQGM